MDRTTVFYVLFGAALVLVPTLEDRFLKDRVSPVIRVVVAIISAVSTGVIFFLIKRQFGVNP